MSVEELTGFAVSAAGIATIITQLVKDGLIDPRMANGPARDATIRSVNYLLNLGLLVLSVVSVGGFSWGSSLTYLALAFGQSIASYAGYQIISNSPNTSTKTPTPTTISGQPAPTYPTVNNALSQPPTDAGQ